jgi:hypothetical protein
MASSFALTGAGSFAAEAAPLNDLGGVNQVSAENNATTTARYRTGTYVVYRLTAKLNTLYFPLSNVTTAASAAAPKASAELETPELADGAGIIDAAATEPTLPAPVVCQLKVLKNEAGKLQVNFQMDGRLTTVVALNDFDLATLFLKRKDTLTFSDGKPVMKTLAAAPSAAPPTGAATRSHNAETKSPKTVSSIQVEIPYAGQKITVLKSDEVPFGVVEITSPGFNLALVDFAW